MAIYTLNFLTIPLYSTILKNKRYALALICFNMWLIMVLRYPYLGVDTEGYSRLYDLWKTHSFGEMVLSTRFIFNQAVPMGKESGYVWLNWICAHLGFGFQGFLIIHATICMVGLWRFLRDHAEKFGIPLAIMIAFGVWADFFCILRQAIATVIVFNSVRYITERRLGKFLLCCCVAILFHKASIAFVLIYFLYKIKVSYKVVGVCSAVFAIWAIALPIFYSKIVRYIVMTGTYGYELNGFQLHNMLICMLILFYSSVILSHKMRSFEKPKHKVFFWCFCMAIVLEITAAYIPVFSRVAMTIYIPFAALLFGDEICEHRVGLNERILNLAFYTVLFVFFLYTCNGSSISPYIPFWEM